MVCVFAGMAFVAVVFDSTLPAGWIIVGIMGVALVVVVATGDLNFVWKAVFVAL